MDCPSVQTSNLVTFIEEVVHTLDALFEWPTFALNVCLKASISSSRHPASAQLWPFRGLFRSSVSQGIATLEVRKRASPWDLLVHPERIRIRKLALSITLCNRRYQAPGNGSQSAGNRACITELLAVYKREVYRSTSTRLQRLPSFKSRRKLFREHAGTYT
jgi:hypothetical protein